MRFFGRRKSETEAIVQAVEALGERLDRVEKALARQAREAGKSALVLERQAEVAERAVQEVRTIGERMAHIDEARRQVEREAVRAECRAEMVGEFLPVLDGLWAAMAATEERAGTDTAWKGWRDGLAALHRRGEQLLISWNVHPIPSVGRPFDAGLHRIVEVAETAPPTSHPFWERVGVAGEAGAVGAARPGTGGAWVLAERRRGYVTPERVLRFAEVVVWRGDAAQTAPGEAQGAERPSRDQTADKFTREQSEV